MIKLFKDIAAKVVLNKISKQTKLPEQRFNLFFQKSYSFLLVMPENEDDFTNSFLILEYLENKKKNISILTYDYRVSKLPVKFKSRVIDHGVKDMNKFALLVKDFTNRLNEKKFDVVLDLIKDGNYFHKILVCKIKSLLKVGFEKPNGDKFYNVMIRIEENNSENSYQNFLNCLRMF